MHLLNIFLPRCCTKWFLVEFILTVSLIFNKLGHTHNKMKSLTSFMGLSILQNKENRCREHLHHQPDNMTMRIELAWCLYHQTLYRTGNKALTHDVSEYALLEAWKQTSMVLQLCSNVELREEATLLQELMMQLGGDWVSRIGDRENERILQRLLQNTFYQTKRPYQKQHLRRKLRRSLLR